MLAIGALFVALLIDRAMRGRPQPVEGAVFVTGCDSGMGEVSADCRHLLHFRTTVGVRNPTKTSADWTWQSCPYALLGAFHPPRR